MRVLFLNHASLLIQHGDRYLLTDPWYNQPAFGSWLPALAPYVHPGYLAALGDRLIILISHGHDDHLDDRLLGIFDKNTRLLTASFKSPSVVNRLKRLGFNQVGCIGEDEVEEGGLYLSSYIAEDLSHDDAAYLIRGESGAVVHANDNWYEFTEDHAGLIRDRVSGYSRDSVLLFSQTNSASGYPLNYDNLSTDEQDRLLRAKVAKMVEGGLRNGETLGLKRMFSYAGFATPYVKGKDYDKRGLFPTGSFLRSLLKAEGVSSTVDIEDLFPGDYVQLPEGAIVKAFVNGYQDETVKSAIDRFYHVYGNVDECMSFRSSTGSSDVIAAWLRDFLNELNGFVIRRVEGPDSHFDQLLNKSFRVTVEFDCGDRLAVTVVFGRGLVDDIDVPNKECIVGERAIFSVLSGVSLFEDLYTGYNACWRRHPSHVYNRDIIMMIVMFSYVCKNRLAHKYLERYAQEASCQDEVSVIPSKESWG